LVRIGIIAVVFWAVRHTLIEAWAQVSRFSWRLNIGWLFLSGIFYLIALVPAALYWFVALRQLGQKPRFVETLRAYYVGGLGKYVPGKAMVVIMRTAMIRSSTVHTTVAAASVFLETFTMMAVGSLWALLIVLLRLRHDPEFSRLTPVMIAVFVLLTFLTLPSVFRWFLQWTLRKLPIRPTRSSPPPQWSVSLSGSTAPGVVADRSPVGPSSTGDMAATSAANKRTSVSSVSQTANLAEEIPPLSLWLVPWGWILMSLVWWGLGLSGWAALKATGMPLEDYPREITACTGSVAFGTVAGFCAVVVPGGIGVREAVLAEGLVRTLSYGGIMERSELAFFSLLGAALLRLVWVIAELASAAIFMLIGRRPGPPGPPGDLLPRKLEDHSAPSAGAKPGEPQSS